MPPWEHGTWRLSTSPTTARVFPGACSGDFTTASASISRSNSIRAVRAFVTCIALRAYDESVWETVLQTTAFAEDLPDSGGALHKAVHTGIRGFRESLERWRTAVGPGDLAALAACGSEAIGACLDEAVSSGRACIDTYADAIGDGNVSREEALALNQALADWKADLAVLQAAMSRSFEALREVRRDAAKWQENRLPDGAETMMRAMAPWLIAAADDSGSWTAASPSYLELAVQSLREVEPQE